MEASFSGWWVVMLQKKSEFAHLSGQLFWHPLPVHFVCWVRDQWSAGFFRAEPQGPFEMRKAGAATPGSAWVASAAEWLYGALQNGRNPKCLQMAAFFWVPCVNLWSMFCFFGAPGHFRSVMPGISENAVFGFRSLPLLGRRLPFRPLWENKGICNDRGSRRLAAAEALFCAEIECPRAHWRGRNRGSVSSGQRGPSV